MIQRNTNPGTVNHCATRCPPTQATQPAQSGDAHQQPMTAPVYTPPVSHQMREEHQGVGKTHAGYRTTLITGHTPRRRVEASYTAQHQAQARGQWDKGHGIHDTGCTTKKHVPGGHVYREQHHSSRRSIHETAHNVTQQAQHQE